VAVVGRERTRSLKCSLCSQDVGRRRKRKLEIKHSRKGREPDAEAGRYDRKEKKNQ
jgi:hypothetical protein